MLHIYSFRYSVILFACAYYYSCCHISAFSIKEPSITNHATRPMCSRHRRCICKRVEHHLRRADFVRKDNKKTSIMENQGLWQEFLQLSWNFSIKKTLEDALIEAYEFACSTWERKLTTEELKTWNVECAKRLRAQARVIMQQKQKAANCVGCMSCSRVDLLRRRSAAFL